MRVAGAGGKMAETNHRLENTFSEIDAIDDAINAANSEREPYNEATGSLLRTFLSELRSDRLIKQADNNPFVKVSVEATLVVALTSIEKTMV